MQTSPSAAHSGNQCPHSAAMIEKHMFAWVDQVVIHYDFCPFAKFVRNDGIRVEVSPANALDDVVLAVKHACEHLDTHSKTATTLLTFSDGLKDFHDYLLALDLAQQMMASWGYDGVYQLASFHPDYTFGGEDESAPSNFTNRAPYPVFHLIREADITRALEDYPDPESIPQRNIDLANEVGCEHFKRILAQISTLPNA